MSRLNDALKRASQSDRSRQPPAPPRLFRKLAPDRRGKFLALALAAGSALALALAVWFFWQVWAGSRPPRFAQVDPAPVMASTPAPPPIARKEIPPLAMNAPPPLVTVPSSAPAAISKPAPSPPPVAKIAPAPTPALAQAPALAPKPSPVVAPKIARAPAPAPPPPAKPVEPAWPAKLKVAGIFFRKTNPLALINGNTVSEGDEIEGILVTRIENDRVTVEWNGKVKELMVNSGGH